MKYLSKVLTIFNKCYFKKKKKKKKVLTIFKYYYFTSNVNDGPSVKHYKWNVFWQCLVLLFFIIII